MIDQTVVFLYLLLTLGVGLWAGRKVKNLSDYVVGGTGYRAFAIFATLTASFIGGGFTMGLAEKTFLSGLAFVVAMWGFSLKEVMIAKWIAPRMVHFQKAISVGEIMGQLYGRQTQLLTGVASVIVCAGILGAQVSACGYILGMFTDIDHLSGSLLAASIVVVYAAIGGLKSVVAVDILHFSVLAVALPIVFVLGLWNVGGWDALMTSVPDTYLHPVAAMGWGPLIILFLSFFFGETLCPPYMQRLLIGRSVNETIRGTMWSALLSFALFAVVGCIGLIAWKINPALNPNLALPHVISTVMPVGLRGLAIAGMLAVVMSSADAFLNAAAIAFVHDIVRPLSKNLSETKALNISRGATVVIGAGAIAFALSIESILDILLYTYQFWTPCILVPLVAGLMGLRTRPLAFYASAFAGIAGVLFWNVALGSLSIVTGAIEGALLGICLSAVTFGMCSWSFITKQKEA
jgi:SSS family solute:Na+ symporter